MVRLLNSDENESIRLKAIDTLGNLGDQRAAAAIAARLKEPSDREPAARRNSQFGTCGRGGRYRVVIRRRCRRVRRGCKLLGDIGGPKSVAALQAQVAKQEGQAQRFAQAALDKLRSRPLAHDREL